MTEKRYFKREWEEEYYIFDSETISENEFDEKVEYEDYQAFADSMQGDEVVELLNELHEENEQLKKQVSRVEALQILGKLEEENEQLKYNLSAYMVDLNNYKGKCSALEIENEQLRKECKELRDWIDDITTRYKEQRGIDLENDLD